MSGQTYAVPNVSVLPQLAVGGLGTAAPYTVRANTNTQGIGVGDVNSDGLNDVVASYGGNRPNAFLAVLTQTGSSTLVGPVSYPSYDIPEPVDVADLDLDGRADVVTLHGGWSKAGAYLQQLDGTLGNERCTRFHMRRTTTRTGSRSAMSTGTDRPTSSSPTTTTASWCCGTRHSRRARRRRRC